MSGADTGHGALNSAEADPPSADSKATAEDYATLEFEAMTPGLHKELGTLREWMDNACNQFPTMVMAIAMLEQDHHGMARIAAAEPGASADLAECVLELRDRYRDYAKLLDIALTRAMAGIARAAAGEA